MSARLLADAGAIRGALVVAQTFARDAAIAPDAAERLLVVVEEWVANLVEHGELANGTRVVLRLALRPGVVRLTITDAGRPFDPRTAVFKGPNEVRGGGAGLALIHAWSRIEFYGRRRGRNRLVLGVPLD